MIRTSVAISAASSRPDSSTRPRSVGRSQLEDLGGVLLGEALQRHQQEGLPRPRGDLGEVLLGRQMASLASGLAVHRDRIPDLGEQAIEGDPRIAARFQHFRAGDQGFQGGGHIGVAGGLAAGQRAGITAQKRQMLELRLVRSTRNTLPFHGYPRLLAKTPPGKKSSKNSSRSRNQSSRPRVGDGRRGEAADLDESGTWRMGDSDEMKQPQDS